MEEEINLSARLKSALERSLKGVEAGRKQSCGFDRANVWETPPRQPSCRCGSAVLPAGGGNYKYHLTLG